MAKKTNTEKQVDITKLTLKDAKFSLQKLELDLRSGLEKDVSRIKKIKKHIARLLTAENNTKNN
jgi:ribosomal protein L29